MTGWAIIFLVLGLALVAWLTGRTRANQLIVSGHDNLNSLPSYHGWYMALWTLLPALLFIAVWTQVAPALASYMVLDSEAAKALPLDAAARGNVLAEARALSRNPDLIVFNEQAKQLAPIYRQADSHYGFLGMVAALLLCFSGGAYAYTRVQPQFRARHRVEQMIMLALLVASLIAILTTIGIVYSLIYESIRFFGVVSPIDFLFGTFWNPSSDGSTGYGAIPLFWGTIFIGAIIAMAVAIPFGLMSAVYLTQYASPGLRRWMKPILEVLAGVPTVVYGYFAALTVAPAMRDFAVFIGIPNASSEAALAAGVVMGVMIIPFVSSMADDSIAAVPNNMRDGSLAMGATKSETIRNVLIPAALPGVVGGVLLAVSRAIGETMIVVMAAGLAANLTANPFASMTTVTVQIVQLLTGDTDFDSPAVLAAFALGLTLFVITLLLNLVALRIVKRYREAYE